MGRLLKILIIAIAIGAILLLIRRALARRKLSSAALRTKPLATHQMVQCSHCGVHIPESQAIYDGTTPFCGEEHRRAGARI